MNRIEPSPLLRFAIRLDAVASGAVGSLLCVAAPTAAAQLGAPTPAVIAIGVFCLGYALLLGALAQRPRLPLALPWTLVIGNALWALASVLLHYSDAIAPTPLASALLLAQAALVFGFAELQWLGLRRSTLSPALQPA